MFFFFNDTATTEIYTLSLHDALPIWHPSPKARSLRRRRGRARGPAPEAPRSAAELNSIQRDATRSEEHTSELQSRQYLVCRLLLEKKKKNPTSSLSRSNSAANRSSSR